jgi:hypothetical protein
MHVGVVVHRQSDLLEMVAALGAAGRLPRLLHRRQQQRDEDADDGDHDQQFDQGKSAMSIMRFRSCHGAHLSISRVPSQEIAGHAAANDVGSIGNARTGGQAA